MLFDKINLIKIKRQSTNVGKVISYIFIRFQNLPNLLLAFLLIVVTAAAEEVVAIVVNDPHAQRQQQQQQQ